MDEREVGGTERSMSGAADAKIDGGEQKAAPPAILRQRPGCTER
ncbi:hypothetical protein [Virgisporangium aurantiacum]|nr:hypothetical protein [Virgisporangium aurantiacum]